MSRFHMNFLLLVLCSTLRTCHGSSDISTAYFTKAGGHHGLLAPPRGKPLRRGTQFLIQRLSALNYNMFKSDLGIRIIYKRCFCIPFYVNFRASQMLELAQEYYKSFKISYSMSNFSLLSFILLSTNRLEMKPKRLT